MKPNKSKSDYMKLFREMTDTLIEIAEHDDVTGLKTAYLDKATKDWKIRRQNSYSTRNSTPSALSTTYVKYCYRCNDIWIPNHEKNCVGKESLCTHCNKQGHLKICCGQLGYFPFKTK